MSVEDSILSKEGSVDSSSLIVDCVLGRYTEIGPGCKVQHSRLGDYSYLYAQNDVIYADIGKFCSIATAVRINPVNHPSHTRVAQHHMTYRCSKYGFGPDDQSVTAEREALRVILGNDVWVGHAAILLGGVTVGDGAVVAAGAVLTHDVQPYEIVGGVPARHIGWRFPEPIRESLLRIRWWDWDHETVGRRLKEFNDPAEFCRTYDPEFRG